MKTKQIIDIPHTPNDWLAEIVEAYSDAYESIPFGIFVGQKIKEKDLFHMTPQICLKFRGIKRTKENVNKATEAMLVSYVATEDKTKDLFINPHIAFGFGYLASHYGMGLLTEDKISEIMKYLEEHQFELQKVIETRIRKKDV